ncbi:MAG TPA: DUF3187 family protein [Planctomycetota bacterium]|nr:DUF3187 family protein [Planctomycetota bacterium]
MRRMHVGGWLGGAVALAGCVAQPHLDGPLPVRNQHPAQLTVLHLPPASTTPLGAGALTTRVDAAYSNMYLFGSGPTGSGYRMDGEYLRVGPHLAVGLGSGFQADVELPFAHTSGGFLDDFVIGYHNAFGLPDQGRNTNPRDDFDVAATKNGIPAWHVDSAALELLDVPIGLTWQCCTVEPGRLGVALRAGIEFPTGNEHRGYGNGEIDTSLGLLLEYHVWDVGWYGHVQHTFAGTPESARVAGLHFADVTSAGLAAELPLGDTLNGFVQVEWETSTLRELAIPVAERDQLLLWLGGRLRVDEQWGVELGFGEDLIGNVSPDFTAWLGIAWLPGQRTVGP